MPTNWLSDAKIDKEDDKSKLVTFERFRDREPCAMRAQGPVNKRSPHDGRRLSLKLFRSVTLPDPSR
jgi:hypothetical protein